MAEEMFDAENVGIGKGNPNGYAWVAPKGTPRRRYPMGTRAWGTSTTRAW